MSRRLGEILIAQGQLTEPQLHRALTAQLVFGGHLGSSLLEMGFIAEQTLGETLAHIYGVGYAEAESLSRVPYEVVRSLPAGLVQKHKVIPLRLEGRVLHLAMIDPKNILAIDEISFVTGYRIVPWVSPEVRILQALETCYDVARAPRFVTLARELSALPSPRHRLHSRDGQDGLPQAGAAPRSVPANRIAAAAQAGAGAVVLQAGIPAPPPAGRAHAEAAPEPWETYGYGRSWQEVAESIDELPRQEGEEADTRPQTAADREAISMLTTSRRLAEAASVEDVIEAILSYAAARLARTLFFVVRGGAAVAWSGQGWSMGQAPWRDLVIPMTGEAPSLLSLVPDAATHYLGGVGGRSWAAPFYARLHAEAPRTALLVPVRLKGRPVAFLYGDGAAKEILSIDLPSMLSLCGRAGFALHILILRNKILAP